MKELTQTEVIEAISLLQTIRLEILRHIEISDGSYFYICIDSQVDKDIFNHSVRPLYCKFVCPGDDFTDGYAFSYGNLKDGQSMYAKRKLKHTEHVIFSLQSIMNA